MPRWTPRTDITISEVSFPLPPGTRRSGFIAGTNKRKSQVIDEAYVAWQREDYGMPSVRGVLRRAAEAYVEYYLGRPPRDGDEFIETTKRIQQSLRNKARKVQAKEL